LLVLFWVVAIRPQRKRQRETAEMQQKLQPGQQVMTGAGLLATVHAVEADVVVLEIAPGVYARHVRQAIVRIMDSSADGDAGAKDASSSSPDATPTAEDSSKGGGSSTKEGPIKEN
jgi:preprotein translocase subunit YajC